MLTAEPERFYGYQGGHRGTVAVSSNGEYLFPTTVGVMVASTEATEGKLWLAGDGVHPISNLCLNPKRSMIVVTEKRLKVALITYSYPAKRQLQRIADVARVDIADMRFSRDGSQLVVLGDAPGCNVSIFHVDQNSLKLTLLVQSPKPCVHLFNAVLFSPVVTTQLCTSGGGHIELWSYDSGTKALTSVEGRVTAPHIRLTAHVWLPDGSVACGSTNGDLYRFTLEDPVGQQIFEAVSEAPVTALVLTKHHLVAGCEDGAILFIGLETPHTLHRTVRTGVTSMLRLVFSPEWHTCFVAGASQLQIVHIPGYDNPLLQPESVATLPAPKVATLQATVGGSYVGVAHLRGAVAAVVGANGIAGVYDYGKNGLMSQVHVGPSPIAVRRFGDLLFAVASATGTVRFVDASKAPSKAVVLRAKITDGPVNMFEVNRAGAKLLASDGKTIAFFSRLANGEVALDGLVRLTTPSPVTAIAWVDGFDGFLVCQQGGDVALHSAPFFEEKDEIAAEALFVNSWRLDFPLQTMLVAATHDEAINLLVHSFDKESKLYLLDRTLPVDRKDRESKAVKPQFTMRDHDKKGIRWVPLRSKFGCSISADGKLVLRDISGYLPRLAPTPPAKEKRDPMCSVARHASLQGGVSGVGISDDEQRLVTVGGDGALIVWTLGRQAALPSTAFQAHMLSPDNTEVDDTLHYLEKRKKEHEEFERTRHQGHRDATRRDINRLRERLRTIRVENDNAAEDEKVPLQDFLIDAQKADFEEKCALAIQDMCEVERYANLNRDFIMSVIKKECWDSMAIKLTKLRGIANTALQVTNFHERKGSAQETALLRKVKFLRLVEQRDAKVRGLGTELRNLAVTEVNPNGNENDHGRAGSPEPQEDPVPILGQLPVENEAHEDPSYFLYNPLTVFTRNRAISQMVLLGGRLRCLRWSFNKEFEKLVNRKKEDIMKLEERNVRCRLVLKELDEERPIFAASFGPDEDPKNVFEVADADVPADKSTDPDEKKRIAQEQEEKQRWFERHGSDDAAEKALKAWMDGRLEKEIKTLQIKIDKPEFAEETSEKFVPLEDRSDEQQRIMRDYEKAVAKRIEEVNAKRLSLQTEFAQLQKENLEQAKKFDVLVAELFTKRLAASQECNNVELAQVKLVQGLVLQAERVQIGKKMEVHRQLISDRHARAVRATQTARAKASMAQQRLDQLREDEKTKEKNLRQTFPFSDPEWGEALVRTFTKKKPKKLETTSKGKKGHEGGDPLREMPVAPSLDPYALVGAAQELKIRRFMEDPQFILPRFDQGDFPNHVWEPFQRYRQDRLNAERDILILSEEVSDCLRETTLCEEREQDLEMQERDAFEQFEHFQKDSLKERFDVDELHTFRQGKVEVEQAPVVTDYADAILIHYSQIERLNQLIRESGKAKMDTIRHMNEQKKEIRFIDWEMDSLSYGVKSFEMELRHLHTLRVTKRMQEYLNGGGEDHNEIERRKLTRHISHVQESMAAKIEDRRLQILKLKRAVKDKELENMLLLDQVAESKELVDERQAIRGLQSAALDVERTNKLMHDMRQTRNLEDVAKAQQQEMLLLKKEIDRLRERTFPSFAVVSKRVVGNPDQN